MAAINNFKEKGNGLRKSTPRSGASHSSPEDTLISVSSLKVVKDKEFSSEEKAPGREGGSRRLFDIYMKICENRLSDGRMVKDKSLRMPREHDVVREKFFRVEHQNYLYNQWCIDRLERGQIERVGLLGRTWYGDYQCAFAAACTEREFGVFVEAIKGDRHDRDLVDLWVRGELSASVYKRYRCLFHKYLLCSAYRVEMTGVDDFVLIRVVSAVVGLVNALVKRDIVGALAIVGSMSDVFVPWMKHFGFDSAEELTSAFTELEVEEDGAPTEVVMLGEDEGTKPVDKIGLLLSFLPKSVTASRQIKAFATMGYTLGASAVFQEMAAVRAVARMANWDAVFKETSAVAAVASAFKEGIRGIQNVVMSEKSGLGAFFEFFDAPPMVQAEDLIFSLPDPSRKAVTVSQAHESINKIQRVMESLRMDTSSEANRTKRKLHELKTLYNTTLDNLDPRPVPMLIWLAGAPGAGKTTMIQDFARTLLAQDGIEYSANSVIHVNVHDKYPASGGINGEATCMIMNDVPGNYSDFSQQDKTPLDLYIQQLVDSAPVHLRAASVEQKGIFLRKLRYLIITTNANTVLGESEVLKLERRFDDGVAFSINFAGSKKNIGEIEIRSLKAKADGKHLKFIETELVFTKRANMFSYVRQAALDHWDRERQRNEMFNSPTNICTCGVALQSHYSGTLNIVFTPVIKGVCFEPNDGKPSPRWREVQDDVIVDHVVNGLRLTPFFDEAKRWSELSDERRDALYGIMLSVVAQDSLNQAYYGKAASILNAFTGTRTFSGSSVVDTLLFVALEEAYLTFITGLWSGSLGYDLFWFVRAIFVLCEFVLYVLFLGTDVIRARCVVIGVHFVLGCISNFRARVLTHALWNLLALYRNKFENQASLFTIAGLLGFLEFLAEGAYFGSLAVYLSSSGDAWKNLTWFYLQCDMYLSYAMFYVGGDRLLGRFGDFRSLLLRAEERFIALMPMPQGEIMANYPRSYAWACRVNSAMRRARKWFSDHKGEVAMFLIGFSVRTAAQYLFAPSPKPVTMNGPIVSILRSSVIPESMTSLIPEVSQNLAGKDANRVWSQRADTIYSVKKQTKGVGSKDLASLVKGGARSAVLEKRTKGGREKAVAVKVFFLSPSIVVLNRHYLYFSDPFEWCDSFSLTIDGVSANMAFSDVYGDPLDETEVVYVQNVWNIGQKDFVRYLPEEDTSTAADVTVCYADRDHVSGMATTMLVQEPRTLKKYWVWAWKGQGAFGECGTPAISSGNDAYLLGFVSVAGNMTDGTAFAGATRLTKKIHDRIVKSIPFPQVAEMSMTAIDDLRGLDVLSVQSEFRNVSSPYLLALGTAGKSNSFATRIYHTSAYEFFAPRLKEPYCAPKKVRGLTPGGEWSSAVMTTFKYINLPDSSTLAEDLAAMRAYLGDCLASKRDTKLAPLSLAEAIFGQSEIGVARIEFKTSLGPTLRKRNLKTKYDLFTFDESGMAFFDHHVNEEITDLVDRLVSGVICPVLVDFVVKDEVRPLVKVEAFKIRLFSTCDFVFNAAMRMLVMPLITFLLNNRYDSCIMGTLNAGSREWGVLAQWLKSPGNNFDVDYSAFDTSHSLTAFVVVGLFFKELALALGYDPKYADACYYVTVCLGVQVVNYMGDYVVKMKGMPSGVIVTLIFNSIRNAILIRKAFARLCPEIPLSEFRKHVHEAIVGDDNALGVDSVVAARFNAVTVFPLMREFGYIATPAKKGNAVQEFVSFEDLVLVKRKFVFDEEAQEWFAPLEEDSIIKAMCFQRKDGGISPAQRLYQVAENYQREFFLYGRERFVLEQEKLCDVFDKLSVQRPKLFLYENLLAEFLAGEFRTEGA